MRGYEITVFVPCDPKDVESMTNAFALLAAAKAAVESMVDSPAVVSKARWVERRERSRDNGMPAPEVSDIKGSEATPKPLQESLPYAPLDEVVG